MVSQDDDKFWRFFRQYVREEFRFLETEYGYRAELETGQGEID